MYPTKEQHQILCKYREEYDEDPGKDQTSVRRRKHDPYTESPNSPRPIKVRQVKYKVKSMFISFYNIKGNTHEEFVLAGKIVNSAYYCDVLRRLRENV
jgi:hypothetical protein